MAAVPDASGVACRNTVPVLEELLGASGVVCRNTVPTPECGEIVATTPESVRLEGGQKAKSGIIGPRDLVSRCSSCVSPFTRRSLTFIMFF